MEKRMKKLVTLLNEASKVYYQEDKEIISNYEYDKLYDELVELEKKTGIILPESPTQKVGYEIVSKLEKDKHEEKALSLDKTKDREFLKSWYPEKNKVVSFKEDGLTVICYIEPIKDIKEFDNLESENSNNKKAKLIKAVTRGNGEIGEIITHNAKFFHGLPQLVSCKNKIVVRGEAVISYSEFDRINSELPETENKYKNPRNLASGTVRQLNSETAASRNVHFKAFELVKCDENELREAGYNPNSFNDRLAWLESLGFEVVEHILVNKENESSIIEYFEKKLETEDFPSDGLVAMLDDIAYGKSLGTTGKFPRCGIAFKWADELAETTIREIEWNTSRTGLINPVAVFDTVELEGTEVSRATAHNVSILKKMQLSIGSKITVYKSNMIIPTINENICPAGPVIIPDKCPVCGSKTKIHTSEDEIETLYCENPKCTAKHIKSFAHFVKRDSMNIENLSEATLEKLINAGFIKEFEDIFELKNHKEKIEKLEGMGKKSVDRLLDNIEKSKNTTLAQFLSGLGIPLIGRSASKEIQKKFDGNFDNFIDAYEKGFDFNQLNDFGEKMSESLNEYLNKNLDSIKELAKYMTFGVIKENKEKDNSLEGIVFVITGSLNNYENRDQLKEKIESLGGKVTGSVTKKTNYLINNDVNSNSGKNKKAKELGVKIISEEEFLELIK